MMGVAIKKNLLFFWETVYLGCQEMFCANKRKKRPYSICPYLLRLVLGFDIEISYFGDAFNMTQ
jgi:hypothetical protein